MKRVFRICLKLFLWCMAVTVVWTICYRYVPVPTTISMITYSGDRPKGGIRHQWIPIERITPSIQLAVICAEDQKFLNHRGFDLRAIKQAYQHNKQGGRMRGGSTISQQTAKNVFLWQQRSWLRKGLEVYFTFLIETFWSKERILEVYLNSVEMGPGVFGVEEAAQYWFGKSASSLSRAQSAALAAILPNPSMYKADPPSSYIQNRRDWIIKQMNNFGPFLIKKSTKKANN